MKTVAAKSIETRSITDEAITALEELTPKELEAKYKNGDFLYMDGIVFVMVYYSATGLPSGQSVGVTYWSELYDLEIDLDFKDNTVIVSQPGTDWRRMGH